MTRISFYISKEGTKNSRLNILFRIVKKAYFSGHKIYIVSQDEKQAKDIDSKLWTREPNRFIPHGLVNTPEGKLVAIGWGQEPEEHNEILINLFDSIPPFFSRFDRLIEIVMPSAAELSRGRTNWKYYQDRGYLLEKYNI